MRKDIDSCTPVDTCVTSLSCNPLTPQRSNSEARYLSSDLATRPVLSCLSPHAPSRGHCEGRDGDLNKYGTGTQGCALQIEPSLVKPTVEPTTGSASILKWNNDHAERRVYYFAIRSCPRSDANRVRHSFASYDSGEFHHTRECLYPLFPPMGHLIPCRIHCPHSTTPRPFFSK